MKPLYLSLKGFGPYIYTEIKEEDFLFLTENRLFLISGEIGAGKTTLFDAILYALYGEGTIEGRTPNDLISHFIKNKTILYPEIIFKFFLDGKTYKIIKRLPWKDRPESVSLWIEDKLFSTRKNEIKEKIKELFRLDAKQFKKVFLIPQGEYRKIITAKGEEREHLLETIFETFMFSQLEEFLKNRLKELKTTYQTLIEREEDLKKIAGISNWIEIKVKIENQKKELEKLEQKKRVLVTKKEEIEKTIIEYENFLRLYQTLKELSKKLEELKNKEPEIKEKETFLNKLKIIREYLSVYEKIQILWKELKNYYQKKKNLTEIYNKNKEEYENLKKLLENLSNSEKEIEIKKHQLEKLKEIKIYFEEKIHLEKSLKEIHIQLEKKLKDQEELKNQIKTLKTQIEHYTQILLLLKEKERISKLLKSFDEYKILIKKLEISKSFIEQLKKSYEKLEELKKNLEIKNYAQHLRNILKSGQPCPVCGSLIHPNPIKPENLTEKIISLEKELKEMKKALEKENENFYLLKANIETLERDIQFEDEEMLKNVYEEIEKKLSNFSPDEIKEVSKFLEKPYKNLFEKEIERLRNKLNFLEEKELKEKKEIEELSTIKISLNGKLSALNQFIKGYTSLQEIQNYLIKLEEEITSWEYNKKVLENKVEFYKENIIKIESELNNVKEFLAKLIPEYRKNLFSINVLRKRKIIRSLKDLENLIPKLAQIEEIEEEVKNFYYELNKIQNVIEENKKNLEIFSKNKLTEEQIFFYIKNLKTQKQEIEESLASINQGIGSLNKEISQLQEILNTLEKIKKEKKEIESTYPSLEFLSSLIIGRNKKGVSFHSFVLSIFAQLILKRANLYFKEFSFGRYKFIEDEVLQKKFNLEIFDHYTGTKREVKTLSGGESFLATLSLALGISDVIIHLYRSRPFESLFIDEGFGSLDENTLEKVITILFNLANYSGRVIGIISHLKELKDKFPIVLEVYKDQFKGSYIKINKK